MAFIKSAVVATAVLLASSATAKNISAKVPVEQDFAEGSVEWDGRGDMYYRWTLIRHNGQLHMCGVMSSKGGRDYVKLNKAALKAASLKVNGKTALRDMRFFSTVSNANRSNKLVGQQANCTVVDADPSQKINSATIEFQNKRYKIYK